MRTAAGEGLEERQNRTMRSLSRRVFPETETVPDDASASIEVTRAQRRRQAVVTEAAALRRARAECAARAGAGRGRRDRQGGEGNLERRREWLTCAAPRA
ncbi:hypothetical protein SVIO_007680 [Streptomyces violaceusniger]|uniref:Uncharacterized protein n=1 Tax=Streptomyces violaceusniger TaxID=68280 RepID=A0A4D4KML5_STRVO|nr:hypothetical protein SVIO_007680 [Streptomyces violaceusniger]